MEGPPSLSVAEILEHEAFVRGLARAALGADDHVDDVVQETLAAGVGRPGLFDVRGWLATVARRRSVDHLRREATRRRHEDAVSRAALRTSPAPEELLAREEARRALVEELVALDAPSREVLMLRYYEDLPPREIAARLALPVETVRTRTKRALARLRERLDARHGGDRRRWAAPLAAAFGWAAAASSAVGVLLPWIVGAAAVILVGAGAAVFFADRERTSPGAPSAVESASADRPRLEGSGRTFAAAPLERGTSRIEGWVRRNDEPASATVELRRVAAIGAAEIRAGGWLKPGFASETDFVPVARTDTDARGAFRFDGLPPGQYVVRGALASGTIGEVPVYLRLDGLRRVARVDVVEGPHVLSGRVVGPGGAAASARVTAVVSDPNVSWEAARAFVETDADGRFTIAALPAGPLEVRAYPLEDGLQSAYARADVPLDVPLTVEVSPPAPDDMPRLRGRIEGSVAGPDGKPVAGVLVCSEAVTRNWPFRAGPSRITDDAGRFVLEGLGAGAMRLYVHERGWTTPGLLDRRGEADPLVVTTDADGRATVSLRVVRTGVLRGTVRDEAGEPIAGAALELRAAGGGVLPYQAESWGVSDVDGAFLIETIPPDSECELFAVSPDLLPALARLNTPAAGDARVDVIGRRMDSSRWAEVEVAEAGTDAPLGDVSVGLYRLESEEGLSAVWRLVEGTRPLGEDGRLLLGPLPNGELRLHVNGAGIEEPVEVPLVLPRTVVRVKRAGFVQGRVVLPEGRIPYWAKLRLEPLDPGVAWPERPGASDDEHAQYDGTFVLSPLPPGRWRLHATQSQSEPTLAAEAVVETGARDVVLRLEPPPAAVATPALEEAPATEWHLRVVGPRGEAIPTARLTVLQVDKGRATSESFDVYAPGKTFSRSGGAASAWFEARNLKDDRGRPLPFGPVLVGPDGLSRESGAVELRVDAERRLRGRVQDEEGVGVRGAHVEALARWPALLEASPEVRIVHASGLTDAEGRFDLGGLADLEYELRLTLPRGFYPGEDRPVIRAGADDVALAARRTVSPVVTVLDEAGEPIANAKVRAFLAGTMPQSVDDERNMAGFVQATTDLRGRAVLRELNPDRPLVLRIGHAGAGPAFPHQVDGWVPRNATVRVKAALGVAGRVVGEDGRAIAGAEVRVEGTERAVRTDERGRFRTERLQVGVHRVRVRNGPLLPETEPVEVAAGSVNTVLRAPRGVEFEVRVAGWIPQKSDVSYAIRPPSGSPFFSGRERTVPDDGVLRWGGFLPDSTLSVVVRTPNGLVAAAADVHGGEPATVRLEPAEAVRGRLRSASGPLPPTPSVEAEYGNGATVEGVVAEDGTFVIEGLPRGARVRLEAWAAAPDKGPHTRRQVGVLADIAVGSTVDFTCDDSPATPSCRGCR